MIMTREQEQLAVELDGLAQRMRQYFQQVLDSINRIADVYGLRELAQKAKTAAEAETPPPEPQWKYVKLTNPDTKERVIAERSDDNAGWLIPGAVIIYGDNEVTDVEPVAVLTVGDADDLLKLVDLGDVPEAFRFFAERGLEL